MIKPLRFVCAAALTVVSLMNPAHAQVTVSDAWVRATVPQQKATGMFASVVSAKAARWCRPHRRWPMWWRSTKWPWKTT